MALNPPRKGTWAISILLGAMAILNHYGQLGIPVINEGEFLILALAFLLLLMGSTIKAI